MATVKLYDRAGMNVPTIGSGTTLSLGSALGAVAPNVCSFIDFNTAGAVNGDTLRILLADNNTGWEISTFTYNSSGPSLQNRTVEKSSNGGSPIILTGNAQAFIMAGAADIVTPGSSPSLSSVTIAPATNTINQGISVTQTGPTSGTNPGPIAFNLVDVTMAAGASGSGLDAFNLWNTDVIGSRWNTTVAGAITEGAVGGTFATRITTTASLEDVVSLTTAIYANVAVNGGHVVEAGNDFASIGASGSCTFLIGREIDIGGATGGSIAYRIGLLFNASSQGTDTVQGSTLDTAIGFTNGNFSTTGAWKTLFSLTNCYGQAPVNSSSNMFAADTSYTMANVFYLPNLTVTGNILDFPNVQLSGAGGLTLAQGIEGTTAGGDAASGFVGEYQSTTVASGSAVTLTSGSPATIASLTLPAGDWDIQAGLQITVGSGATLVDAYAAISTTTNSLGTFPGNGVVGGGGFSATAGFNSVLETGTVRASLSGSTTYYAVALAGFSGGTVSSYGIIRARRVR